MRQQVIAQFFDNTAVSIDPKYSFPSWNFRSVLAGLTGGATCTGFPLKTRSLLPGAPVAITLTIGGAAYARFRVGGNTVASVTSTSNGGAVPNAVELILVRTQ